MTPAQLRQLFSFPLPVEPTAVDLIPAAVLVPLFIQRGNLQVLFTQRTNQVRDHQGQISFPGGVHNPEDPSYLATALRETQEEIGLAPEVVEVLGALPPISTITGYFIHSFVGLLPYPYHFKLNDKEVARLIILPVMPLLEPERWSTRPYELQGKVRPMYYCQYEDVTIWGATARILIDLLTRLRPAFHPVSER